MTIKLLSFTSKTIVAEYIKRSKGFSTLSTMWPIIIQQVQLEQMLQQNKK